MSKCVFRLLVLFALGLMIAAQPAYAQKTPKPGAKNPSTSKKVNLQVPNDATLKVLIRMALVTLNNANWTGNYTVLRDLGAPGFRSANSAAKLGMIFAKLRQRRVDLSAVLATEPKLYRKPSIGKSGKLLLSGFVPILPRPVKFDLLYQNVGGAWLLFGISVRVEQKQLSKKPDPKMKIESTSQSNSADVGSTVPVPLRRPKITRQTAPRANRAADVKKTIEPKKKPKKEESSIWPW